MQRECNSSPVENQEKYPSFGEGLAEVFSLRNMNLHSRYKKTFPKISLDLKDIVNLLNIDYRRFTVCYKKAGSFAKYIIVNYSINSFRGLYLESYLDCDKLIYYRNGKRLGKDFLNHLIFRVLREEPINLVLNWMNKLGMPVS